MNNKIENQPFLSKTSDKSKINDDHTKNIESKKIV